MYVRSTEDRLCPRAWVETKVFAFTVPSLSSISTTLSLQPYAPITKLSLNLSELIFRRFELRENKTPLPLSPFPMNSVMRTLYTHTPHWASWAAHFRTATVSTTPFLEKNLFKLEKGRVGDCVYCWSQPRYQDSQW